MGKPWRFQDIDYLKDRYPTTPTPDLAKRFGRTPRAVKRMAERLGLRKVRKSIFTEEVDKRIRDYYPITFNRPLAKWLGISLASLQRRARELGVRKIPNFLEIRRDDISELKSHSYKSCPTAFKKGVRSNPSGEFKKGYKETPEVRERRIAGIKKANERKRKKEAFKKRYGL